MRIAYYCPMKPPDHPVPSGDRRVARLLRAALRRKGHEVELASRLRAHDAEGAPSRQRAIARRAEPIAARLIRRYRTRPPDAWLTYHLYHRAPDHLGPAVSRALGIPYLVAEPSHAPKQAGGPWDAGYRAAETALRQADHVVFMSPDDAECVTPLLKPAAGATLLPPFLDAAPFLAAARRRADARMAWAGRSGADPDAVWLLAVGMMRPGDKLASYRVLARALRQVEGAGVELLVAGDGPAAAEVRAALAGAGAPVRFLGAIPAAELPQLYAAADILAWPAVREAYGMAILEAQAAGLPVVAGYTPGVAAVVAAGETGLLTPAGDAAAFARALAALIGDRSRRRSMGKAAMAKVRKSHDLEAAARILDGVLRRAVTAPSEREAAR